MRSVSSKDRCSVLLKLSWRKYLCCSCFFFVCIFCLQRASAWLFVAGSEWRSGDGTGFCWRLTCSHGRAEHNACFWGRPCGCHRQTWTAGVLSGAPGWNGRAECENGLWQVFWRSSTGRHERLDVFLDLTAIEHLCAVKRRLVPSAFKKKHGLKAVYVPPPSPPLHPRNVYECTKNHMKRKERTCHEGREERRTFQGGIEHSRDVLPLQPDAGQCDRRSWLASCLFQTLSFYTQTQHSTHKPNISTINQITYNVWRDKFWQNEIET